MKNRIIINLLFISIVFFIPYSCKEGYKSIGSASVDLNGVSWDPNFVHGTNTDSFEDAILLKMSIKDESGANEEVISLRGLKPEIGDYPLKYNLNGTKLDSVFCTYVTFEQQGEIVADVYYPLQDNREPNNIKITSYEKGSKTISGTFEFTLVIENDSIRWYGVADTLRFRNGVFETKIAN